MTRAAASRDLDASFPALDRILPHSSRVWDVWLGGKDNYSADRDAADQWSDVYPTMRAQVRTARAFCHRALQVLTTQHGIRQFLDIGAGLPTATVPTAAETVHALTDDARVVYVDTDPVVLSHLRVQAACDEHHRIYCVRADLRRTGDLLTAVGGVLDLSRPIGVLLNAVVGHLTEPDAGAAAVHELVELLPHASALILCDGADPITPGLRRAERAYAASGADPYAHPDADEMRHLLKGLHLLDPGLVPAARWHPPPQETPAEPIPPDTASVLAAVGVVAKSPALSNPRTPT